MFRGLVISPYACPPFEQSLHLKCNHCIPLTPPIHSCSQCNEPFQFWPNHDLFFPKTKMSDLISQNLLDALPCNLMGTSMLPPFADLVTSPLAPPYDQKCKNSKLFDWSQTNKTLECTFYRVTPRHILLHHITLHIIFYHLVLHHIFDSIINCILLFYLFVHLAFFKVYESCYFELEDLSPELPPQLWDT